MNINKLKGVGEKTTDLFHKIGVYTTDDLIRYYPRDYDIYNPPSLIADLRETGVDAVYGSIAKYAELKRVRNLQILSVYIRDPKGLLLKLTWFNMPFLKNQLKLGESYVFRGRVLRKGGTPVMEQPVIYTQEEYKEKLDEMQPIYHLTKKLTNGLVVKTMKQALDLMPMDKEYLPLSLRRKYELAEYNFAIKNIHFPVDKQCYLLARKRLVFDEFFLFIATIRKFKDEKDRTENEFVITDHKEAENLLSHLPYQLTNAQMKVWNEIKENFKSAIVMNRLIQGES